MHHAFTFDSSLSNRPDDRRIGFAIRYVSTAVCQLAGERDSAILILGVDEHHHCELTALPVKYCGVDALARHSAFRRRWAHVLNQITETDAFKYARSR